MPPGAAVSLFPSRKTGKAREKGKAAMVGFRPRPDQLEYLRHAQARGYKVTEVLIKTFDLSVDLEKELGEAMRKVEAVAALENVSVGTVLGRVVKRNLRELEERLPK